MTPPAQPTPPFQPAPPFQTTPWRVDLNADVGEGAGSDAELMPAISSANVACGWHAGDSSTMRVSVELARAHGAAIGAHPGFADRDGFGRREMTISPRQAEDLVVRQIDALARIAAAQGVRLQHVKAHGALYNMAARDESLAASVARATASVDPSLVLVGLAGSHLIAAGARAGLRTASEVFADRGYRSDGSLVPRDQPGALLEDVGVVVPRVLGMIRDRSVIAVDGTPVPIDVETICLHGDTPGAVAFARRLREALTAAGVVIGALGKNHR
jgi:UPF0271 protein